jgi:hypothetical protein
LLFVFFVEFLVADVVGDALQGDVGFAAVVEEEDELQLEVLDEI